MGELKSREVWEKNVLLNNFGKQTLVVLGSRQSAAFQGSPKPVQQHWWLHSPSSTPWAAEFCHPCTEAGDGQNSGQEMVVGSQMLGSLSAWENTK